MVAATRAITETRRDTPPRVLVLTTFDLDEYVYEARGRQRFAWDVPPDELAAAIRVVARGEAVVAPAITRRLLDRFAPRLPSAKPDPAPEVLAADRRETRCSSWSLALSMPRSPGSW
jgi:DNA-binding NarL/FixJ family response regulator